VSSWESPEVREAVEAAVARARQSGPSMPSDVSERLLARLAAEVTADPHATVATPVTAAAPDPGTTADVVVLADHRRRTLRRAMMAAASIVVVLAVGATLLTLGDGPAGHPDRTPSSSRAAALMIRP
jgi:negative regulator of sigma E activity